MYLNGEGAIGTISLQVDLHLCRFPTCCDQSVTQFLQSVTAVGDQLPDEHLLGCGTANKSARKKKVEVNKLKCQTS